MSKTVTNFTNMANSSLIIGISGVTNGGKSTLCEKLIKEFKRAKLVSMDAYFYEEGSGHLEWVPEVSHPNFDVESAINLEEMSNDILKLANEKTTEDVPLIFVDGILLYNYGPLKNSFAKKYFIEITKEECKKRRSTREYEPMDPPGYFDVVVWPAYLDHKDNIKNQDDIVYMDGSSSQDSLLDRVVSDVKAMLKDRH